jgi:hypothetical protein
MSLRVDRVAPRSFLLASLLICALGGGFGCTSASSTVQTPPTAPPRPAVSATPIASATATATAEPTAIATAATADAPKDPPPPVVRDGQDFIEEARLLYRIAACGGDAPVPADLQKAVDDHCNQLRPRIEAFKTKWVDVASPFLATLVPGDAPKKVVYPFAGGDNATMFATYPNAEEYTTISLELTGDVRKIKDVTPKSLPTALKKLRPRLDELIGDSRFSMSETLQKMMTGDIPQELSFLMVGLVVHDLEPVSLRYFRLEKDGKIDYFTADEIAKEKAQAKRRSQTWGDGDFLEAFSNVEIEFKPKGKAGPVRIHRHIAFNLDNQHLKGDPSLTAHLEQKGTVSMMIKAASYLLWTLNFTRMRDYVLGHAALIISDSTAPLPKDAADAGYTQQVWGRYKGARIPVVQAGEKAMKAYWASQPEQALSFRFGYLDTSGAPHLMVTRKKQ